MTTTK